MLKTTVIQAGSPSHYWLRLKEILFYRDLLLMLSYRDFRVRYAQTWLGVLWTLINPVISTFLLFVVFGVVVKSDTEGVPALLFIMAGLCAWNYFARVTGDAGLSLIGAQSIVKKVYFPRLILPLSKALSGLVDLAVVLIILFIMLLWFKVSLTAQALMIIPFIVMILMLGVACGIWVAALSIRYRDFNHIVPIILRMGMFLSPIAYMSVNVPENYQWLYLINPLTGIMEGFRWALFDTSMEPVSIITSVSITFFLLLTGIWYFLKMDQYIADII